MRRVLALIVEETDMAGSPKRVERLSFRVSETEKATLKRAAEVQQQELTAFVLSAAVDRADHVLADRTRFELDTKQWETFEAALERPVPHKPNLARLLNEPSVLEEQAGE